MDGIIQKNPGAADKNQSWILLFQLINGFLVRVSWLWEVRDNVSGRLLVTAARWCPEYGPLEGAQQLKAMKMAQSCEEGTAAKQKKNLSPKVAGSNLGLENAVLTAWTAALSPVE